MAKMCLYLSFMCAGMDMSNIARKQSETGKRQRVKSKSENSARDHSRISPTQPKKETMKSRVKIKSKRPLVTSSQSLKALFEDLKIKGQSCQELKVVITRERRDKDHKD
ncbi:hypothetical protein Tco_1359216 [Tanacetum coccineum]